MKKGRFVFLDSINKSDLEQLRNWRNYEPFKMHFREFKEINQLMQENWFNKIVNNNENFFMFAVRDINTEKLIGCIGLTYVNWVYRNADLSVYIGDDLLYIDNQKAVDAVNVICDYGFNQLNLHKIWTEIYSFDDKKKNFFRKIDFNIDGYLRDNYFYDGKYWDSIILSKLKNEYASFN